jgi:hypothetical protein
VRIVAEFTPLIFERTNWSQTIWGDATMPEKAAEKGCRPGLIDHDCELKQALESLASENSQLKKLVVRLSETVLRNVAAGL